MFSPWDAQLENLRRNLALALATGKPAILHCRSKAGARDAQDALLDELRMAGFDGEAAALAFGDRPPAVIHSFSGPVDYARDVLAMGLAVSFSGLVFRAGEEPSAEVAALVPAGRLLVETDAPFLTPPRRPALAQRAGVRGTDGALGRRAPRGPRGGPRRPSATASSPRTTRPSERTRTR